MTSLASAFVDIRPEMSKFGPELSSKANAASGTAGDSAGRGFSSRFGAALKIGAVLAGAFAVTKGIQFFGDAITQASDLNESVNAVNVTFGQNAGGIKKLGEDAASAVGLSNSEFNGLAVQFSAFAGVIAGKGGDVVGTIDDLSKRGADFASVMNIDVDEAMGLFQSGLAGETEPLRKFGIDMSAAAVQAFAYAHGIGKAGKPLTEQQKVQARYALLMKQTSKTQGDFGNTSDGLANSQRILSARMDDLKASIGARLLPVLAKVVTAVSGFVQGMMDGTGAGGTFANILHGVGDVLSQVGHFIGDVVVPYIGMLKDKFVEAMGGTAGFKKSLGDLGPVATVVKVVLGALFQFILFALPILVQWWKVLATTLGFVAQVAIGFGNVVGGVFRAVQGVVASVVGWFASWVPAVFAAVVGAVRAYVNAFRVVVTTAFNVARAVVTTAVNVIRTVVTTAFNVVRAVVTASVNAVRAVVQAAFAVVRAVVSAASAAVRTAMAAVSAAFKAVATAVGAMATTIRTKIGEAVGYIKGLPGKAVSALSGLGSKLLNSGRALIQGFIDGVDEKIQVLKDKIGAAVQWVADHVPGSPIKMGPLRAWNNTGPTGPGGQLIGRIITGIESQEGALRNTMARVAGGVTVPEFGGPLYAGAAAGGSDRALVHIENQYTNDPRQAAYENRVAQAKALTLAGLS